MQQSFKVAELRIITVLHYFIIESYPEKKMVFYVNSRV